MIGVGCWECVVSCISLARQVQGAMCRVTLVSYVDKCEQRCITRLLYKNGKML